MKNCSCQLCDKAWQAFQFPICIQRTRISFMLRNQFSFRVCNWFKRNRIFESKSKSKKQTKYPSMESHQPYLSFLFRNFLNKQENFTFLPDRLPFLYERQCLKATPRKFPEINKNIHSWYIKINISKKGLKLLLSFPAFSWVLTTPELSDRIANWRHFEGIIFRKSFRSHSPCSPRNSWLSRKKKKKKKKQLVYRELEALELIEDFL